MCSICNQSTCPILCPNHRENGIYTCRVCEDKICNGESYYKIDNQYYHKDCLFDSYDKEELLLLLGKKPRIAAENSIELWLARYGSDFRLKKF